MKPTAEQIKTIALIVDGEAWKAIEDGRDALPGSLWGFRRDIAMEKAMAIAALSVQPAAAVVGEPVGDIAYNAGLEIRYAIAASGVDPIQHIPEVDAIIERRLAEARKAAFIEAAEIATATATDVRNGDGARFTASHIAMALKKKAEETGR